MMEELITTVSYLLFLYGTLSLLQDIKNIVNARRARRKASPALVSGSTEGGNV